MSENSIKCLVFYIPKIFEIHKGTYSFCSFIPSFTNSFYNLKEKDNELHKLKGKVFFPKPGVIPFKKIFVSKKEKSLVKSTARCLKQF